MESVVLATVGGMLGALFAALAVALVPHAWPDLPRVEELAVDGGALAFALALSAAAALAAGALPAWRVARTDPRMASEAGSRATAGRPAQAARDALVIAEVALTVVLLAGAGLLVRSVSALRGADPGFDPDGVLVAPVFLDGQEYDTGEKSRRYYARLLDRLRALPGVLAAGGATTLPASPLGPDFQRPVWRADLPRDERSDRQAWIRMITPGYLEAMRIPVVEGRAFDASDAPGAQRVLAVSESLARSLWLDGSAVGKTLVVDYSTAGTYPYEVVGVVGDVRFRGPRSVPAAEVYFPHAQRPYLIMHVAVRAAPGTPPLGGEVRRILHEIDPQKPAHGVHRLGDLLGTTFVRERRAMELLVAFAATACLLSGLGLYGTLAYRVRQRATEIGVRVALGASRARIAEWVGREGARLVVRGGLLGLAGALVLGRVLEGLLFGVEAVDPLTAGGVLLAVATLGLGAACLPAWRATRLDAAVILRRG
jgi:predicted permease